MGYTTNFEGQFTMDKLPPAEVIVRLRELEGCDGRELDDGDAPDAYCQWELTRDCQHIQWDGGEKFYRYVEWLQYIIDKVLKPHGVTLTGSISYSGEDVEDSGVLAIEDGQVRRLAHSALADTLEELQAFRTFVMASRQGKQLMKDFLRQRSNV